jgi:hypothetical protein
MSLILKPPNILVNNTDAILSTFILIQISQDSGSFYPYSEYSNVRKITVIQTKGEMKKNLPMTKPLKTTPHAGPFLKWAGGKTQLLRQLSLRLPPEIKNGEITRYVEPFVGGGAMFFYLHRRFPFTLSTIFDANEELILT